MDSCEIVENVATGFSEGGSPGGVCFCGYFSRPAGASFTICYLLCTSQMTNVLEGRPKAFYAPRSDARAGCSGLVSQVRALAIWGSSVFPFIAEILRQSQRKL